MKANVNISTCNNNDIEEHNIFQIDQTWTPNCEQDCEWEDEFLSAGSEKLRNNVVFVTIISSILSLVSKLL